LKKGFPKHEENSLRIDWSFFVTFLQVFGNFEKKYVKRFEASKGKDAQAMMREGRHRAFSRAQHLF
jgi:hypothetical protein